MANETALARLREGKERWNAWRGIGPDSNPDLQGADLQSADLSGFNLAGVHLNGADLRSANLTGAILAVADLTSAQLTGARLDEANMASSSLRYAILVGARALGAHLESADLRDARLDGADLTGIHVDDRTQLSNASVVGCRIERRTLVRIPAWGGLTAGRMMDMDIVDPVATMRSYYSGVWQWVHVAALTIFVAPYVLFVARKYLAASLTPTFVSSDGTVPLWQAVATFVWTGGTGTAFARGPFLTFCFAVLYNALRAVLLFKTKTLELREQASGLPAQFSLAHAWGWGGLLAAANWGFFANVLLVLYHTGHFLQIQVRP